ncbi:MAG: dCTP deaminase [Gammaproteobacteria bacterium]|nr:MAG: dCTP deaminase [Gammaproteobacteria bacterium]TLY87517.1 MAG: dCTP deaminase [Gammaproteobacteria bacterium]
MSIKSDNWIRRMAREHAMIEPFEPGQVREANGQRIVSYGTSSYGYDVRCADEFKIFTNINSTIVDPKNFDEKSFVDFRGDVCIVPPNSFALARTVEYFRIPRNVLVATLGKSTYARCFSGDTRVALVDGTSATLEQMARGHDAGELYWGYSIGPGGVLIVTLLDAPRFIGRDTLLEIALDSGELIHATPDHLFMRRNGRMAQAHALRPGDALMPLYRDLVRGYEVVYQPIDGHMYPTHRLADEWNLRHEVNYGEEFDPDAHGAAIQASLRRRAQDPRWREDYARAQAERRSDFWSKERYAEIRNHKVVTVRQLPGNHDVYCLTVPEAGNFALEAGVFVRNCGIIVNVTPLEPEWEGNVTLEFSNTTPLPAKIYANEGVAQMLFFESDEVCSTSYRDRGGKYQGQRGVTLPKT